MQSFRDINEDMNRILRMFEKIKTAPSQTQLKLDLTSLIEHTKSQIMAYELEKNEIIQNSKNNTLKELSNHELMTELSKRLHTPAQG